MPSSGKEGRKEGNENMNRVITASRGRTEGFPAVSLAKIYRIRLKVWKGSEQEDRGQSRESDYRSCTNGYMYIRKTG